MEFHNKLQELRKKEGITQEELAEKLYVSRTAISKWESGRGYPSIDSLKAISNFFSISIDELICSEEIISIAKEEQDIQMHKCVNFICGSLDVLLSILLFIPVFANGLNSTTTVSALALTGIQNWIKLVFIFLIIITALNGIFGVVFSWLDKPILPKRILVSGVTLLVVCSVLFMITRQPYAGIFCFIILSIKCVLLYKNKNKKM